MSMNRVCGASINAVTIKTGYYALLVKTEDWM